jgi:quinol monooxygenase YgiN
MITAIVERRFHMAEEKTENIARLLIELRRRMMQQSGCVSSETLHSMKEPSLWVDVSTWTYSDQWKKWENAPERREIQSEIENLLLNSEQVSIFNIIK